MPLPIHSLEKRPPAAIHLHPLAGIKSCRSVRSPSRSYGTRKMPSRQRRRSPPKSCYELLRSALPLNFLRSSHQLSISVNISHIRHGKVPSRGRRAFWPRVSFSFLFFFFRIFPRFLGAGITSTFTSASHVERRNTLLLPVISLSLSLSQSGESLPRRRRPTVYPI
jgi:hypothetical protein